MPSLRDLKHCKGLPEGAAILFLGTWVALAAIRPFAPAISQPGLDASWIAVMGMAADQHLRWGTDMLFPYGPASPLVTLYGNASYLRLTLPLLLAISGLFAACAVLLVQAGRMGQRSGFGRMSAAVITLGLAASGCAGFPDALFLVLPLLAVLLVLVPAPATHATTGTAIATAAMVGVIGMAKASFPIAAVPLLLLGDAACLVRRRYPVLTPAFVAGFIASDLAYGQHLGDLPALLQGEGQVVAGYGGAMSIGGSRGELLAFLSSTALLLGLLALAEWRAGPAPGRSRFALPIAFFFTCAMLFKAGFVRQDLHTMIAWDGLALAAAVLAWSRLSSWRRDASRAVLFCAVIGALTLRPWIATQDASRSERVAAALSFEADRLLVDPARQLAAGWDLLRHPGAFAADVREAEAQAWQALADAHPLPRLAGSVDTIPSIQSQILANGLDYRPRPSFQEYATYTPELLAANRAFIVGPRAPDWIIFGLEPGSDSLSIDGRYPNLAEGTLWPDLLRLYRPECSIDALLALKHRESPATLLLGDVRRATSGFDEVVPVRPAPGGAATFVRIDAKPTLLGRIAALVFKPALLAIRVDFADRHQQTFRFIDGIGRAGFVLSPLVRDAADFVGLAQGRAPSDDRRVVGFAIHVPAGQRSLFARDIAIEMQSVGVAPPSDVSDPPDAALGACQPPA